ncbi:MAG TPA: hypothetical protein VF263_24130 [Longimicrobiaceae bacterium]
MTRTLDLARVAFGLAVVGALGLGATQALAEARPADARAVCYNSRCIMNCLAAGYEGGYCLDGECGCYGYPPNS